MMMSITLDALGHVYWQKQSLNVDAGLYNRNTTTILSTNYLVDIHVV